MLQNWVYMTNKIASLHYLTQDIEQYSHEELVEIACKNGIKWIQLRVKNKDESELHVIAEKVRKITLRYNCTLIINDNVSVAKDKDRVTLRNAVDASGLQKEISFSLDENRVLLTHRLIWHGAEPIELAPWTITQVPLGGVAVLPQSSAREGSAPTRNLAVFPYASLTDPRLELHDDLFLVHGSADPDAFKIGSYNPFGWAAYLMEKVLFIKRFPVSDFRMLPDMGSNVEVYVRDEYLEVETLGKLTWLKPGEAATFEETWEVIPGVYSVDLDGARKIMKQLS